VIEHSKEWFWLLICDYEILTAWPESFKQLSTIRDQIKLDLTNALKAKGEVEKSKKKYKRAKQLALEEVDDLKEELDQAVESVKLAEEDSAKLRKENEDLKAQVAAKEKKIEDMRKSRTILRQNKKDMQNLLNSQLSIAQSEISQLRSSAVNGGLRSSPPMERNPVTNNPRPRFLRVRNPDALPGELDEEVLMQIPSKRSDAASSTSLLKFSGNNQRYPELLVFKGNEDDSHTYADWRMKLIAKLENSGSSFHSEWSIIQYTRDRTSSNAFTVIKAKAGGSCELSQRYKSVQELLRDLDDLYLDEEEAERALQELQSLQHKMKDGENFITFFVRFTAKMALAWSETTDKSRCKILLKNIPKPIYRRISDFKNYAALVKELKRLERNDLFTGHGLYASNKSEKGSYAARKT
jgi:DNA repair exonuclease SbcCD ATPase subunit